MSQINWQNHLQDEALARKEFLTLWSLHLGHPNRLNTVAFALGWKYPAKGTPEHPVSWCTDPYTISFVSLLDGLTGCVSKLVLDEKFTREDSHALLTITGELRHIVNMFTYQLTFGHSDFSEVLLHRISDIIQALVLLLEQGDITKTEETLLDCYTADLIELSMRAMHAANPEDSE